MYAMIRQRAPLLEMGMSNNIRLAVVVDMGIANASAALACRPRKIVTNRNAMRSPMVIVWSVVERSHKVGIG